MISKILNIKNFGIFHDFTWNSDIPKFEKFNLIYGANRSGKTTLSRVLASCEKNNTYGGDNFEQLKNGKFKIALTNRKTIKSSLIEKSNLKIRVFNQDFINKNISFDPQIPSNSIVYISQEDIKRREKLYELDRNLDELSKKLDNKINKVEVAQDNVNNFLTNNARDIANKISDKAYTRTKLEKKIKEIGIDNFVDKIVDEEEKDRLLNIITAEAKEISNEFMQHQFSFELGGKKINNFQEVNKQVSELLCQEIEANFLERLQDDSELNNWVKDGFDIHINRNETQECLFCENQLEDNFLTVLSHHYNDEYKLLLENLRELKNEMQQAKISREYVKEVINSVEQKLFPNLLVLFKEKSKILIENINRLNSWIDEVIKELEGKEEEPLSTLEWMSESRDFLHDYNRTAQELDEIIFEHNSVVKNYSQEVLKAKNVLEAALIAEILSDGEYKEMLDKLIKAEECRKKLSNKTDKVSREVDVLRNESSTIGEAIDLINEHLVSFFGTNEISLRLDADSNGYTIVRNGNAAHSLSEAEKTAIAFSYFIVKTGEEGFSKESGIIFVDDPISSFDSNFIYHCFTLLKVNFTDVEQLFVTTHNFQFFNLVKEWMINKNDKHNKKSELFMIETAVQSNTRTARIVELDKTLKDHKSEYSFLYKKLKYFITSENTEYEDLYMIGNVARRFFDIFADFKVQKKTNQKEKLGILVKNIIVEEERISEVDEEKVYKLLNEFSHNHNPTSHIEHKDGSEIKETVRILLEIVKKSDPLHFRFLNDGLEM